MPQCKGTEGREVGGGGGVEEHPHRSRGKEDGMGVSGVEDRKEDDIVWQQRKGRPLFL